MSAIVLISCVIAKRLHVLLDVKKCGGFNVIKVHIVYVTIKVGVAKHSWTSWPYAPYHCVPTKHFQKLATVANAK